MTDTINEPLVGIGKNGKDPVIEKLDIIIEGQEANRDLLEEISEKLADLELPYNAVTTYD